MLLGHVEEELLRLNRFFLIVDTCVSSYGIARQSCAMVVGRLFASSIFSVQHISDLNSKFALRPHHCGRMVDIQSATAEKARGKEQRRKAEELEMWANAQRDGRPAVYRWRPLLNAAKFG